MKFIEHQPHCFDEETKMYKVIEITSDVVVLMPNDRPALTLHLPRNMFLDQYWMDTPFTLITDKKRSSKAPI